jgi:hypothetical protein
MPAVATIAPSPVSHLGTSALAVIPDSVPLANIPPFGGCTAAANPSPAAVKPCTPQPAGPWPALVPWLRVMGRPVLASDAVLVCAYGGVISVVTPGCQGVVIKE